MIEGVEEQVEEKVSNPLYTVPIIINTASDNSVAVVLAIINPQQNYGCCARTSVIAKISYIIDLQVDIIYFNNLLLHLDCFTFFRTFNSKYRQGFFAIFRVNRRSVTFMNTNLAFINLNAEFHVL